MQSVSDVLREVGFAGKRVEPAASVKTASAVPTELTTDQLAGLLDKLASMEEVVEVDAVEQAKQAMASWLNGLQPGVEFVKKASDAGFSEDEALRFYLQKGGKK